MLYCIIISIYFSVSFLCVSRLDDERQAIGAQFEMLALVLFLLMPAITPSRGSLYFILGEMLCHDAHNSNRIGRRKKRGATTPFGHCISTKEQEKPFTPAKVAPIQYSPPPLLTASSVIKPCCWMRRRRLPMQPRVVKSIHFSISTAVHFHLHVLMFPHPGRLLFSFVYLIHGIRMLRKGAPCTAEK